MRMFAENPKVTLQTNSANSANLRRALSRQTRDVRSIIHLQRIIGNQAARQLLRSETEGLQGSSGTNISTGFAHDVSRISIHASGHSNIQPYLQVSAPGDIYEQEADRVADQVLRQKMPKAADHKVQLQAKPLPQALNGNRDGNEELESRLHRNKGGGDSLSGEMRAYFEPRMRHDFSKVMVHTDNEAARMNQELGAQAFTSKRDIFFGAGRYNPHSIEGKRVLAHELVHVIQQSADQPKQTKAACGPYGPAARVTGIQRVVEVRPPGRGEASAFDRRQELVDRLNAQSAAIQYRLEGRVLRYLIVDDASLAHFDRQMQAFIDQGEVAPMRLITGAGYVQGAGGAFQPLSLDSFVLGYVDLDDLLASDDLGFQARLIHLLTERFATRDYERRIGTAFTMAEFNPAHRAAHEAEAELFQDVIGDPTIRFLYAEPRPNGTWVVAFRSDEGYRIFRVVRGAGREVRGAEVWVRTRDGRRLTVDQLRAERRAAAPAPP